MPNSDTANNGNTDDGDKGFQDPNALETELSEAEEQALVNKTLGLPDEVEDEEDAEKGKDDKQNKDEGTDELVLADVIAKETDDLSDDEKTFLEDNKDDLTGKQVKALTEAGVFTDEEEDEEEVVTPPAKDEDEKVSDATPQTDDLWIEVEKVVVDKDGNQSTEKVKLVYDPKDPNSFVPDDFQFKTDKQLFEILEAKAEMAALYKERASAIEEEKTKTETQTAEEKAQQDTLNSWDDEITELVESGVLEEPKAKPGDKNFLQDPAVQKIDKVFKFMASENDKRAKEGKPIIRTFGVALSRYDKQESKKAEDEAKKEENKKAKEKGSLVGGTSAASGGEQHIYKAGSAASVYDVQID